MEVCDDSAISRTSFARLFAVIGTTFGTGDGSSTFNVLTFVIEFRLEKDQIIVLWGQPRLEQRLLLLWLLLLFLEFKRQLTTQVTMVTVI